MSDVVTTVMLDDDISSIEVGMSSVIGRRKEQQDTAKADNEYTLLEEEKFIAILCDGMGGLAGGKLASELCATHMQKRFHSSECEENVYQFYRNTVAQCDAMVFDLTDENGAPLRAGSTLASVIIKDECLHWASVGDSHIYLLHGNQMHCLTKDHNYLMLLNERVKKGEITQQEAEQDRQKEALVSYVGMGGIKYMDVNTEPYHLAVNDYVILCSDGLYRTVCEDDIKNIVHCIGAMGTADDVAKALTDHAMAAGKAHQDNTTVIVIRYIG